MPPEVREKEIVNKYDSNNMLLLENSTEVA